MENTVLIAIIGGVAMLVTGLIAAIPGILALRQQKRKLTAETDRELSVADKNKADAAKVIKDMAIELVQPYRDRVAELEDIVKKNNESLTLRIEELETRLDETRDALMEVADCAHQLYSQIKKDGGAPVCEPPNKEKLTEKFGGPKPKKRRL